MYACVEGYRVPFLASKNIFSDLKVHFLASKSTFSGLKEYLTDPSDFLYRSQFRPVPVPKITFIDPKSTCIDREEYPLGT